MNQRPTFAELLQASRESRNDQRPAVRPKSMNLPTDAEERSRVLREAARRVIERHRNELEHLAHK